MHFLNVSSSIVLAVFSSVIYAFLVCVSTPIMFSNATMDMYGLPHANQGPITNAQLASEESGKRKSRKISIHGFFSLATANPSIDMGFRANLGIFSVILWILYFHYELELCFDLEECGFFSVWVDCSLVCLGVCVDPSDSLPSLIKNGKPMVRILILGGSKMLNLWGSYALRLLISLPLKVKRVFRFADIWLHRWETAYCIKKKESSTHIRLEQTFRIRFLGKKNQNFSRRAREHSRTMGIDFSITQKERKGIACTVHFKVDSLQHARIEGQPALPWGPHTNSNHTVKKNQTHSHTHH